MKTDRNRNLYFSLVVITICCGLLSRSQWVVLPAFVSTYAGDTLWGLMVFLGFCFLLKKKNTWQIGVISLLFSFAIEFSQLYQAAWINSIRHTRLGGLVLGFGFMWSDLLCYAVGILCGICVDQLLLHKQKVFRS